MGKQKNFLGRRKPTPIESPDYAATENARPLFVIAPPRSGTTMLTRVINSHPRILLTNETSVLLQLAENIQKSRIGRKAGMIYGKNSGDQWASVLESASDELVADFYNRLATEQGKRELVFWGEKHPHFNRCLEFLTRRYPDATYVYVIRDPRDSVCSIADMTGNGVEAACRVWKKISDAYEDFVTSSPPERQIVTVVYEKFIADYDDRAEAMFLELGVDYATEARNYVREYSSVDAHSSSSFVFKGAAKLKKTARTHDYADKSVSRWKRDLSEAERDHVNGLFPGFPVEIRIPRILTFTESLSPGMSKTIFIVGMYKSGTSWLLAALSAHPDLIGLRELDLVKAVCRQKGAFFESRSPKERVAHFFGSSSWCSFDREFLVDDAWRKFLEPGEAQTIDGAVTFCDLPSALAIRLLLRMRSATVNNKILRKTGTRGSIVIQATEASRNDTSQPLSFTAFDQPTLEQLFEKMRTDVAAEDFMQYFLDLHFEKLKPAEGMVLKGADQLGGIEFLDAHVRDGKKIVIVRDGRDAALSAAHFRKLVERRSMAWSAGTTTASQARPGWWSGPARLAWKLRNLLGFHTRLDYLLTLVSWQRRVRRLLAYAQKNDIFVVRYEDLSSNFEATMTSLLAWLGLRHEANLVSDIKIRSSFETMSGRKRGDARDAVVRKGQVGEWQETLSGIEKFLAWRIAGRSLDALGYTIGGKIARLKGFPEHGHD